MAPASTSNFAKSSGATCCGKSKPAGGTPAAGTCSQHGSSLREFPCKRATRKQAGKNEVEVGAVERTRTFTVLLPPAPQAGASANSATTAKSNRCFHSLLRSWSPLTDVGYHQFHCTIHIDCPAIPRKINQTLALISAKFEPRSG